MKHTCFPSPITTCSNALDMSKHEAISRRSLQGNDINHHYRATLHNKGSANPIDK